MQFEQPWLGKFYKNSLSLNGLFTIIHIIIYLYITGLHPTILSPVL